jgi:hypothetical protein
MVALAQFDAAVSERSQLGQASGGPVDFRRGPPVRPREALKAFIQERSESVQEQLSGKKSGYVPRDLRPGPGGPRPPGPPGL